MNLLEQLYLLNAPYGDEAEMVAFIEGYLQNIHAVAYWKDDAGNLYITKGLDAADNDTVPCAVAHLDEVHSPTSKRFVQSSDMLFTLDIETGEQTGCGADDKNGIWCVLRLLETVPKMKAALFVSEENGCVGSNSADLDFFQNVRFVLQADRRGNNNFIINAAGTDLCDEEFVRFCEIEKFGYEAACGSITDVKALKDRGLDCPCANISCGYYNAHHDNEFTIFDELCNCLELMKYVFGKV